MTPKKETCPLCKSEWCEEEIELQKCIECGYPVEEKDLLDDLLEYDEE
jgi:hypothetical protein